MKFSDKMLSALADKVKLSLSQKRFEHVKFVVDAAKRIGEYFPDIDPSELACAALLHDITKEIDTEAHLQILKENGFVITEDDMAATAILHSLSAPFAVKRDYPEFATDNVLSAVKNHTTGDFGMSVFDRIIFIADYVEDSRVYDSCVKVRDELFASLSQKNSYEENELALNMAVLNSIIFTENDILKRGRTLNKRSIKTKEYFCGLLH